MFIKHLLCTISTLQPFENIKTVLCSWGCTLAVGYSLLTPALKGLI